MVLCILSTAMFLSVNAQARERVAGYYFGTGGVLIDASSMENELAAAGFNKPRDWAYTMGAGFYSRRRLVLEAELNGIMWKPTELGVNETKLRAVTSSINLGINLLPYRMPVALYPYIGSGFGKTRLLLNQTEAQFPDAAAKPLTELDLVQNNYTLRAGIGFDADIKTCRAGKKNLMLGIRAGYMYDFTDNDDWESDDVDIKNGPEISMSGPYLKLVIGKSFIKPWQHGKKCKCPGEKT